MISHPQIQVFMTIEAYSEGSTFIIAKRMFQCSETVFDVARTSSAHAFLPKLCQAFVVAFYNFIVSKFPL